jgi:hypothetical protein
MKRNTLFTYQLAVVITGALLIGTPATSRADAILWSEAQVFLDTLSYTTTGDLSIDFQSGAPNGTLTSRDEIMLEDVMAGSFGGGGSPGVVYDYRAGDPSSWTTVENNWYFSSTGSGNLKIDIDYFWEFAALPYATPDAIFGGPDNMLIDVLVNGSVINHHQLNAYPSSPLSGPVSGRSLSIGGNDANILTIRVQTQANGLWEEMPTDAAPVPEPSTLLLFGAGLVGLASISRKQS